MANAVEKDIAPNVKTESEKTRENITKYEEELKQYFTDLKKESFYIYGTGVEGAFEKLAVVQEHIEKFDQRVADFEYFCRMFEFSDELNPVYKNLDHIKTEVNLVTRLWKHIKKSQEKFAEYKERHWGDIDVNDMEDEIKKLRKELGDLKGLDRKTNAFIGIKDDLQRWTTFIPLLGELKDPSMDVEDNRHWKDVQTAVKKEFEVVDSTPLGVIWDLKLFEYKDAIEDITDKAKQEAKMEKILNKIEERWKEVVFERTQHKDTNIMLLKMSDDNFEALEENQVQTQNMSASKYLAYFETTVNKWRESLAAIFDVVGLLSEVQKTWSFLENLFIHSEEVMKELPNESEKFRDIDKRVKAIIENGNKIMNILKFCTQDDVYKKLDEVQ